MQATLLDLLRAFEASAPLTVVTCCRQEAEPPRVGCHCLQCRRPTSRSLPDPEPFLPLSVPCAACSSRDSLDAVVAAAAGVPHCRVWVLVSDGCPVR